MRTILGILAVIAVFISFGCAGPTLKAPMSPSGDRYDIVLLLDNGITENLDPDKIEQYQQVAEWMSNDLLWMLKKAGYQAQQIDSREQFSSASGKYLLTVRLQEYNAGSKAARMFIGFGAGSTSLDIFYELYGKSPDPLLSRDNGYGSSIAWTKIIQKLDQEMVDDVSRTLSH